MNESKVGVCRCNAIKMLPSDFSFAQSVHSFRVLTLE